MANITLPGFDERDPLRQNVSLRHVAEDLKANYAPLVSPAFTGDPTAPTPATADNDTSIATTAYVKSNLASYAPLASPALTGNPTAPTPTAGDNDTSIATTAYVQTELAALSNFAVKSQTDFISGIIAVPTNTDYRIVVQLPYAMTITSTTTRSTSGTCTATFKINTTSLGGTANSVSTSEQEQAHSSSNAAAAGDDLIITVSANATCQNLSFTIKFTRTLA